MNINSNNNGHHYLLQAFYHHARGNNGLINFVEKNDTQLEENCIREPSCPQNELHALFKNPCWEKISHGQGGHAKYKSELISGVTVGFKCHGLNYVGRKHLQSVVDNVNNVVKTMFDVVYHRPATLDEQKEPKWDKCVQRYNELLNTLNGTDVNETNLNTEKKNKNSKYLNQSNGTKKFRR